MLSVPFHNVAQRIGPAVAKRGSVRSCPDTKGIHHQDDAAFHDSHFPLQQFLKSSLNNFLETHFCPMVDFRRSDFLAFRSLATTPQMLAALRPKA